VKILYHIRNEFHDHEGAFTKEEILRSIKRGKFTGEEEVNVPPSLTWQKLASHPEFYDAFLRRLFEKDYRQDASPSIGSIPASSKNSSIHQEKTAAEKKPQTEVVAAAASTRAQPTIHLDESLQADRSAMLRAEEPAGTIHPSDIDRLFSESERPAPKLSDEISPEGTAELPPLDRPLDEIPVSPPAPGIAEVPHREGDRRRLVFWGGILTILLVMLFQMGGDNTSSSSADLADGGSSIVKRQDLSPEARKALMEALSEEIQFFLWNDGPLFYDGAVEVAKEALIYEPDSPRFLGLLAVALARRLPSAKNPQDLKDQIGKTISAGRQFDPHLSLFYRAESLVALYEERLPDAKKLSQAALDADPEDSGNLLLAADIAYVLGDHNAVRALAEETLAIEPNNVRPRFLLGMIALEKKDLNKAWSEAVEAIRWNRLYANGFFLLGEVQTQKNALKEAKIAYEQATRFGRFGDPKILAKAHLRLSSLYELAGNKEEANKNLRLVYYYAKDVAPELKEKFTKLDVNSENLKALFESWQFEKAFFKEQGDELVRQKSYPEAMRFYQAARLLAPNDANSLVRVGEVAERVVTSYTEVQKVMLIYERAISRDPQNPRGYLKLALLETEQYNFDRALHLLESALSLAPESSEINLALGKHFYKRQDYSRAREYFIKAQALDSTDSEAEFYTALLTRLYNKDEIREPLRRFYRAYTLDPQNYSAMAEWLKLKVLNYEKTFAVKFLKNLLESDAKNGELQWVFGEVYASNNEPRRAIAYYHKALDADPNSSKFRMSLAKAHYAVSDFEAAVDEFRKASELDQRNLEGHFEAAKILFDLRKYSMSERELKEILERSPNYPGVHRYLSKIYQVAKIKDISTNQQRDKAIEYMKKEVENNPQNAKFTLELAMLYMEYERWDSAIGELTKIANLPSETKAPEYKRDRMRALQLMSMSFRAQGKAENAEGAIRLALSLEPNEPELHRELGYVYHSLQRHREAAKAFEYYLNRSPAAGDAPAIKDLIKKTVSDE
jgi:tetratricopeptide (TPR) repeat protein